MHERIPKFIKREEWVSGAEKRLQILDTVVVPSVLSQLGQLSKQGEMFLNDSVGHLRFLCGPNLTGLPYVTLYATREGMAKYGSAYDEHTEDTLKVSQAILDALAPEMNLSIYDTVSDLSDKVNLFGSKDLATVEYEGQWINFATIIPGFTIVYTELDLRDFIHKTIDLLVQRISPSP